MDRAGWVEVNPATVKWTAILKFNPSATPEELARPALRFPAVARKIFDELFKPGGIVKSAIAVKKKRSAPAAVEAFTLPEGGEVSIVQESTPEKVAEAARWLKKHMPGVAKPGQKNAQQILKEIRAGR